MNRRTFIDMTGKAGLGLSLMGTGAVGRSFASANSKITVAVMGTYSRGRALAAGFARHPLTEVAYICDVDDEAIRRGLEGVREAGQSREPKTEKDFRRALEDPALDALVVSTPIHWHAPASILALKAGKHVYVEKPCSHNIREGKLLVQAADRYNRVVMMGNQRRSWPNVIRGIERLKEGAIGRAYFARCWYASRRGSIGHGRPARVPSGLDYDLWQGPAPRREYRDNLIHYNWHWFWHWGAGELLNNGTHFLDLARWGLGVDYPIRVTSSGGRYHWQDDQETPDTQVVTYDFPGEKTVVWEARSCNPRGIEGSSTGISFHGENGTLIIDGNGYSVYDYQNELVESSDDDDTTVDLTGAGFDLDRDHMTNFANAVRDGIRPNTDIRDANISVHMCHLGNIAHRTGRAIHCEQHEGRIVGDREAMRLWGREYEPGWEPSV